MATIARIRTTSAAHRAGSVFISSTFVDLSAHRAVVIDALLGLGLRPVDMEHMGAQGAGDATSVSLQYLSEAEFSIFIVAWRYGHLPAGQRRSVTHIEYDEAKRLRLPCFVFLAEPRTESTDGEGGALFPAAMRSAEQYEQLLAFRAQLARENLHEYFTTPDDLGRKVATALAPVAFWRPPHALPPKVPGFVGRKHEIHQLALSLKEGQSTGLSAEVAGLAGVGKSALATEVVHRMAADPDAFPGGITWVRCDKRTGQQGLLWLYDRIRTEWGDRLSGDGSALDAALDEQIADREHALRAWFRPLHPGEPFLPALVLLDNVERELPIERAVETLGGLAITVLLTARHELAPASIRLVRLDVLDQVSATSLFEERYRNRGGVLDNAHDAQLIVDIVELLGRLPFAIELAAARAALRHIPPNDLATELREAHRLHMLSDPLDPSRSMRYAFAQSLSALSPLERLCFEALGALAGPDWPQVFIDQLFDALLATWPANAPSPESQESQIETGHILDVLAALSLVQLASPGHARSSFLQATTEPSTRIRVRMHTLLRDFALEELQRQTEEVRWAYAGAMLSALERLTEDLRNHPSALAHEESLIVGALEYASREHTQHKKIAALVDMLDAAYLPTHPLQTRTLYSLRLQSVRALGDYEGEWSALHDLGHFATKLRAWDEAKRYYEEALQVVRDLPDRSGEYVVLAHLGEIALESSQFQDALRFFESSLAVAKGSEPRGNEALALSRLERIARIQRDTQLATQLHNQVLKICQDLYGTGLRGAAILNQIGDMVEKVGETDMSAYYLEDALALSRAHNDQQEELDALHGLGHWAEDQADYRSALRYFQEALAVQNLMDAPFEAQGPILRDVAEAASKLGDQATVNQYYHEAILALGYTHILDAATSVESSANNTGDHGTADQAGDQSKPDDRSNYAHRLHQMGHLAESAQSYEDALRLLKHAQAIAQQIDDRGLACTLLFDMGHVALNLERQEEANNYYAAAVSAETDLEEGQLSARHYMNLANLGRRLGRHEQATKYFEKALGRIRNAPDKVDRDHKDDEAIILASLADLSIEDLDYESAARFLCDEASMLIHSGDGGKLDSVLTALTEIVHAHLNYGTAVQYVDFLLAHWRELRQVGESVYMLYLMAKRYFEQDERDAGKATLRRAIVETAGIEDTPTRAHLLTALSVLAYGKADDAELAVRCCQDAVSLLKDADDQHTLVEALDLLGVYLQHQGNYIEAIAIWGEVITRAQALGDSDDEASALHHLGHALLELKRFEEAAHDFERALAIRRSRNELAQQARMLSDLSVVATRQGQSEASATYREKARQMLDVLEARDTSAEAQAEIAELRAMMHDSGATPESERSQDDVCMDSAGSGSVISSLNTNDTAVPGFAQALDKGMARTEQGAAEQQNVLPHIPTRESSRSVMKPLPQPQSLVGKPQSLPWWRRWRRRH